jgi:hypothetical protein
MISSIAVVGGGWDSTLLLLEILLAFFLIEDHPAASNPISFFALRTRRAWAAFKSTLTIPILMVFNYYYWAGKKIRNIL